MGKSKLHQQPAISNQKLLVKLFILAFIIHYSLFTIHCFSQGVGINIAGNPANSKALLNIDATGMNPMAGVLVPSMSTGERNAITTPVPESLLIYNTTIHCFEAYYNGRVDFGCLFSCGSPFTDSRDGQSYNTVQIGTQCWMTQNLNYGTYTTNISAHTPQTSGYKFCQTLGGGEDATCAMGGLYEWANMMNSSASCNGICNNVTYCTATGDHQACSTPIQGLCPNGWHVPSHYEWTEMENAINSTTTFPYDVTTTGWLGTNEGTQLKSTSGWSNSGNGTNATGFNALPGGDSGSGSFGYASYNALFWTATEYDSADAWNRDLTFSMATVNRDYGSKLFGSSVRCVKN